MASSATFYRQSIWMIGATLFGGALLYIVHVPLARHLPPGEYSIFATLLQVIHLLMIPTLALQIIFTEESASSRSEAEKGQLAGIVSSVLAGFFALWLLFLVVTFYFRTGLSRAMGVNHPMAFWTTMLTGWSLLWLPILQGIMQGRENFKWLGWLAIINGAGRYAAVAGVMLLLGGQIVAVMWAVWLGMMLNLAVGIWQTRDIWKWRRESVQWFQWARKAIPMTVALGCSQIMFSADMVFVQSLFKESPELDLYGFAGTIGRGLIILTNPLVGVMFPKIVESEKLGQQTTALRDALLSAALLAVGALVFCSLFPAELVEVLNKPRYSPAAALIPWFALAMSPLVFSNVLLGALMARRRFGIAVKVALVTALYAAAFLLPRAYYLAPPIAKGLQRAILTVGVFNSLFLLVTAWPFLRRKVP